MSEEYNYDNQQQEGFEGNNNIDTGGLKKKNRTLQYYKFLFYSMKTELKIHDFVKLVRASNAGEISIWLISLVLYANTPKDFPKLSEGEKSTSYKNAFIWFHLIHVLRAVLGSFLIHTFPKSFQVVNSLDNISDEKLETTLFNDLIRETIFFNVTEKIKTKKIPILIYLVMTIINFVFDLVDFLVILGSLSGAKPEAKVVLLTYLMISLLYIIIDLSYVFWTGQLKYVFPKEYLKPIDSILNGVVDKAMMKFKLRKPKTDVISEAKVQQSRQPYVIGSNDMNNGGINILENILSDSFGVYRADQDIKQNNDKYDNRERYQDNNINPPNSVDPMNENKLDA
jgi:hypothetical protein